MNINLLPYCVNNNLDISDLNVFANRLDIENSKNLTPESIEESSKVAKTEFVKVMLKQIVTQAFAQNDGEDIISELTTEILVNQVTNQVTNQVINTMSCLK